jgi:hypothetical protein
MSIPTTNYEISTGQDLNLIFAPLVGTAGSDSGFEYYDTTSLTYKDLSTLFLPYTNDPVSATNYVSDLAPHNGKDLNIIFQGIAYPVWPYINFNNKNTRQSTYDGPPVLPNPPTVKWTFSAPPGASFNENSLVIGPTGIIYIAEDNGNIYALIDNGLTVSTLFSSNTGYTGLLPPTIGVNNIMYVVGPNIVKAYKDINTSSPFSPSILWSLSISLATTPNSPIIGSDGTLYISSTKYIFAVSSIGVLKWSDTLLNTVSKLAIGLDGTIYATASTYLYAVNSNGSIKWQYNIGVILGVPSIGSDGTIYAFNLTTIYAITDTGIVPTSVKWSLNVGVNLTRTISIGNNNKLYVVTDKTVISITDNGLTGSVNWTYSAALLSQALTAVSIGLDGTLYTTGDYGFIGCITDNGASYTINWAFQALLSGFSSPCSIGLNNRIYFGGDHNYVVAI